MSLALKGIEYKTFGGHWIASRRENLPNRQKIADALSTLTEAVPPDMVTAPAFWIRHFIHSYAEGLDVEVCLPVAAPIDARGVASRYLPEYQVLSKTSAGKDEPLGEIYSDLFGLSDDYGLISDEFCMEVLHDRDPQDGCIEVLLVLHSWQDLFAHHLQDVMGEVVRDAVIDRGDRIFLESPAEARFRWTKDAVARLDQVADDYQRYLVLSGCSHVFPQTQTAKPHRVYVQALAQGADMSSGVDALLDFMHTDPGWRQKITREGRVIFSTKNPRDPEAYARATTQVEKRRAACFCPIIRNYLEEGMSPTFCYCSAGFERKQWEEVLEQPVRIDVVKSLLKGDDYCQFAIHLPVEKAFGG